jgi:hypothetical protein
MKQLPVIFIAVLLTVCGVDRGRRPAVDAKQIQAQVEALLKAAREKIAKPLPDAWQNTREGNLAAQKSSRGDKG